MTTKKSSESTAPVLINEFIEQDINAETSGEIPYDMLLKVSPRERDLTGEEEDASQKIVFFCRDCNEIVAAEKKSGKKLQFSCSECSGGHIYLGTKLGINNFFHLA